MAKASKKRDHFNQRALYDDAPRRDPFLDALESEADFRLWLERNSPSLENIIQKISLPRIRVKQKQRSKRYGNRSRKKTVKTIQNRHSRLILILRAGLLPQLLEYLDKRGEKLDKASVARAHQQELPGVLAAINRDNARALIDHLHENGETVTRQDLFLGQGPSDRPGRMPGTLSLALIQYALGLSGDKLGRKDLMRHNNSGRTVLAEMVKQGHGDIVIDILQADTDRLSVQDLQTKRGQGKVSILDSLFTSQTPEIILQLPLRKNKHLSTDIWNQLYAGRLIYRLGSESDGLSRMKRIARSPLWLKLPYAAFKEFCAAFDERTRQKLGLDETRALYQAQRVKALHAKRQRRTI